MFNISENKPRKRLRIHFLSCTSAEVHPNIMGNQKHSYLSDFDEAVNILNNFPYQDKNFCYKCMRNFHLQYKN